MTDGREGTLRGWTRWLLLAAALLGGAAWAPWLTRDWAAGRAQAHFQAAWYQVADGCGLACRGCGVLRVRRLPFAAVVELDYACGMIPAETPEYHQQATGWVSFLGTVHGLPVP
jgi:hypothetical protein